MLPLFGVKKGVKMKKNMVFARFVRTAAWVLGCGALTPMAMASTVNVDLDEEHQVIRGFGGMVHNQWQGGGGLSEADAKIAFGTGDGTLGYNGAVVVRM